MVTATNPERSEGSTGAQRRLRIKHDRACRLTRHPLERSPDSAQIASFAVRQLTPRFARSLLNA